MTETNKIAPGDLVLVRYPVSEKTSNPAHKLDGQQFVVRVRKTINHGTAARSYYELYGAESKRGVPFAFLEDELIKL